MVYSKHDQFHATQAHFNPPHLYKVVFGTENTHLSNPLPLKNAYLICIWMVPTHLLKKIYFLWERCFVSFSQIKVQIFWEGHKNLTHLPLFIWHYLVVSNYEWKMGQIFVAFSEYLNFKDLRSSPYTWFCLRISILN